MRRPRTSAVRSVGTTLLCAAALLAFVAVGLLPHLGLYRPVTVLSQSMRPTFSAGDVVVVAPEPIRDVRVGQVITYAVPIANHYVETHRVISVKDVAGHRLIRTRGDANTAADPWTARLRGETAWRVRAVVPYAGWGVIALRSRPVHLLFLYAVPLLLVLAGLRRIWARREPLTA